MIPGVVSSGYHDSYVPGSTTLNTGSGNFVVPDGITPDRVLTVDCQGAGGGSAGTSGLGGTSGGGGGAFSRRTFTGYTAGDLIPYSVGIPGAAGAVNDNGLPGGDTWFKANDSTGCVAKGGTNSITGGNPGPGGQASAGHGTTKTSGGSGGSQSFGNPGGGGGSGGLNGNGGNGGTNTAGTAGSGGGAAGGGPAQNGNAPGGGAGGVSSGAAQAGRAGAAGRITISW